MDLNLWNAFFGNDSSDISNRYINQFNRLFPVSNQLWGVKNAVWIDTNNAWLLYLEIPELRAVIEKRASMMASNIPVLYDKNGDVVENHWLNDLIRKPNPTQSWSDAVFTMSVQDALYSNVFAYAPVRSFQVRNLFIPLPSNKVQIKLSGKTLKQMEVGGLIDGYTFKYDDETKESIDVNDMVYITTPDGMSIVKPSSRIETLKFPLSNIKAQYHKRNVLLENIGAIGILSAQNSDMGGALPMTPEEKTKIQKDWYRRSKDELIITESQVNWQPMSYPTKDLMLFEELTADKIALIDAFGLNSNLFSSEKGATFTNMKDSIKMAYTDTIIPETQQMYDSIIQQFGLDQDGYHLKADFSHLVVLQEDEVSRNAAQKSKVESYTIMLNDGVISKEQYATEFGIELEKIDQATAQQSGLIQAQTQLRGTVGGLDGIISLNASVSTGQMAHATAVNTLINYYGYAPAIAETMITAEPIPTNQ